MAVFVAMVLASCNLVDFKHQSEYIEVKKHEEQLAKLQDSNKKEYDAKVAELSKEKDALVKTKDKQMQEAANKLYGEGLAYASIPESLIASEEFPRQVIIMHNRATEANAAIGLAPTVEAVKEEAERLKVELDKNRTTIQQLLEKSRGIVEKNKKLVEESENQKLVVTGLENSLSGLKIKHLSEVNRLQAEINEKKNIIIARDQEKLNNAEWERDQKEKMMFISGALALAAIIAAIYVPAFRKQCVLAGIVLGCITFVIMYIQPIHVGIISGICFLILGGWGIIEYRNREKAIKFEQSVAEDTYRAIQELKTKDPETYDKTIKPALETWHTKYDANGKAVPDQDAKNHIDSVLIKVGDK